MIQILPLLSLSLSLSVSFFLSKFLSLLILSQLSVWKPRKEERKDVTSTEEDSHRASLCGVYGWDWEFESSSTLLFVSHRHLQHQKTLPRLLLFFFFFSQPALRDSNQNSVANILIRLAQRFSHGEALRLPHSRLPLHFQR